MIALVLSFVSIPKVLAESVWVRCALNTRTKVRTWQQGARFISLGTTNSFKPSLERQPDQGVELKGGLQLGECLVPKHQLEDLMGLQ